MKKSPNLEKVRETLSLSGTSRRMPRSKKRWRVEIVNENTLASVWRIRLTGIRARIALICAVASIISLVVVVFTFTPLGRWIWGEPDLRNSYVDMSLRLDSLTAVAAAREAYAANIVAILSDSIELDSIVPASVPVTGDTLIGASEAERRFVEQFEADRRFNLSVLSPIAAEGMIFESPVDAVGTAGPVKAVYRGTVIGTYVGSDGRCTIVVQHPNDFISSYGGLSSTFVLKGAKVVAGQRLGIADSEPHFDLWRGGVMLDPAQYITFPVPEKIDK